MKNIIYARVSTENTQKLANQQLQNCKQYCRQNKIKDYTVMSVRGSNGRNFNSLVSKIKNAETPICIITTSVDRITRNQKELDKLKELKNREELQICTANPKEKLVNKKLLAGSFK